MHGKLKEEAVGFRFFLKLARPTAQNEIEQLTEEFQLQFKRRVGSSASRLYFVFDWAVMKMLGLDDESVRVAELLYEASIDRGLWKEEAACADFMRGNLTDPTSLLEQCQESQLFTGYAHFVIALDMLSHGKRREAKEHFVASSETGDCAIAGFWWSKAFLMRVEDPNWLPWLPQRNVGTAGGT